MQQLQGIADNSRFPSFADYSSGNGAKI